MGRRNICLGHDSYCTKINVINYVYHSVRALKGLIQRIWWENPTKLAAQNKSTTGDERGNEFSG
jgi:hypothetical protein